VSGPWRLACLAPLLVGPPLAAQGPAGLEAGVTALAAIAARDFAGAGLSGALRPAGRTRLTLTFAAGTGDGAAAGRGEGTAQFLLTPERTRGSGLYVSGGLAGTLGRRDAGYLVLGLGLEARPGGKSGWLIEIGVGGGVRLAAGWRWRRFRGAPVREP
jgi:hypothetical protein